MNKKVIIGIIAAIVVVAAIIVGVIFLGKEKLQETNLSLEIDYGDEIETATASIGYPINKKVELKDMDDTTKVFTLKEKNCNLKISLVDELESTYEENLKADKEEEGYEEVTFNGYKGYILKGEYRVEGKILLADDESNINKVCEFTVEPIDDYINNSFVDPVPLYNLKEVQTILKSVKYNGSTTVENSDKTEDVEETEETEDVEVNE